MPGYRFFRYAFLAWLIIFLGNILADKNEVSQSLQNCCELFATKSNSAIDMQLYDCIKISIDKHNGRLFKRPAAIVAEEFGPRTAEIGLVTYLTEDILPYAVYAAAINLVYAIYHNYSYIILDPNYLSSDEAKVLDSDDVRWNKVKVLSLSISNETPSHWILSSLKDSDYIMWIDADLALIGLDLSISSIVSENHESHVIASSEYAGSTTMINSGSVLVRNSRWSQNFLSSWWNYDDRKLFSDQEQFDRLYQHMKNTSSENAADLRRKVRILAPDALNSDPPAMTKLKPHNKVIHLMGEEMNYRKRVFKTGFKHICETLGNEPTYYDDITSLTRSLHPQLTLTQHSLLQIALDEYSKEAILALDTFEKLLLQGNQFNVEKCRYLSNTIHHFVYAVEHAEKDGTDITGTIEWTAAEARLLRLRVYKALKMNINIVKKQIDVDKRKSAAAGLKYHYPEEYPELLKAVATAGQHVMLLESLDLDERDRVGEEIHGYMEEMLSRAHSKQHPAVLIMLAHLLTERGMIALQKPDMLSALHLFKQGLEISRMLATLSGNHVLAMPLALTANALAAAQRFKEAHTMYLEAEDVAREVFGNNHIAVVQVLLNHALSQYASGTTEKAEYYAKKVISLLSKETDGISKDEKEMLLDRALSLLR